MIDELREIVRRFAATPIVVSVWCVDRPDLLWRIQDMCKAPAPTDALLTGGVPVYEWYSRYAAADAWQAPECFSEPGVYMKMSNGDYIKLEES